MIKMLVNIKLLDRGYVKKVYPDNDVVYVFLHGNELKLDVISSDLEDNVFIVVPLDELRKAIEWLDSVEEEEDKDEL